MQNAAGASAHVSPKTVGFIGLGVMGRPMAGHLLAAGYPLWVYNRSRAAVEDLAARGAHAAASPRDVAAHADVVITMLPDTPDVLDVILGHDGVIEGARPGVTVVDMSTISPIATRDVARRLGERGVRMLDAPVSGGQKGAQEAALSIMVGGPREVFEEVLPILEVMGKRIVHVGDVGAGQIAKAANQIVVALTIEAISEALVLAAKAGVDPAKVREALLGGFAQSRVLEQHGQRILDRNFLPGFRVNLHRKDLAIALDAGRALDAPLPVTAVVSQMLGALSAAGDGDLDHSGLVRVLERLAGVEVRA